MDQPKGSSLNYREIDIFIYFKCGGVGAMSSTITVTGIGGIPEISTGDDLAMMIANAAREQGTAIENNDVLVVTQKIVSKSEGAIVDLNDITPSQLAEEFATQYSKDPRHVEVVLRESKRIVRMDRGILIVETKHGFVCANAGVDASNVPGDEKLSLLPADPNESARRLREGLMLHLGCEVAVIISDTFGRPWRMGNTDVAIGTSGINPLRDYRGYVDPYGYPLTVSVAAIADQIAGAAELVAGKLDGVPATVVKGYEYSVDGHATAQALVRDSAADLFR